MSRGAIFAYCAAAVLAMAALLLGLITARLRTTHQHQLQEQRAQTERATAELARALTTVRTNQDLILALKQQVSDLEREKELAGQMARSLENEMRQELESKDVTISKLQGRLTVTIVDRVMFDSGEAILKPDGAAVMQKIADLLQGHPELQIHVVGHTDNVPIRPTAQSRFASNWELSTARSLAAVHFLTEKAGVDPRRVGAVGYGEYRPIADNATPEGRAKNRRIAVTILPEAFAPDDTRPLAGDTTPNTNSIAGSPQPGPAKP